MLLIIDRFCGLSAQLVACGIICLMIDPRSFDPLQIDSEAPQYLVRYPGECCSCRVSWRKARWDPAVLPTFFKSRPSVRVFQRTQKGNRESQVCVCMYVW
jgi:hypothetical protein